MNIYRENYWSLFLDFVEDFKEVVYRGYRLSYLVHFPSLIRNHTDIWDQMSKQSLKQISHHHVTDRKQVQDVFTHYLAAWNTVQKGKNGKIAFLEDSLLRIPTETFEKYFEKNKTIFIKTYKYPHDQAQQNIYYLQDYLSRNTDEPKAKIKKQIQTLLAQFPVDHLYQNHIFQHMLYKKINFVIDQIEMMEHLLRKTTISSVIMSSPNHFGRVMAFVAKKHGIPTICMQHGIIGNEFGYLPKVATVDAVYGQFEKDWYLQSGVSEDGVKIIGHPRFDQSIQKPAFTKAQFIKYLKLDKRKRTLLLIVRGKRNMNKWKILLEHLEKTLNLNIILRDFPNDERHPLLLQYSKIKSTKNLTLYDILPHVDAVVSYTSTVALEAMLVGKPVFILHTKLPSYTEYYNKLEMLVHHDPLKLADVIQLYFKHAKWRKPAQKIQDQFLAYAYPDQSSSGQRLRNLVDELTKGVIK
ncbi:hypothetical protein GI584_14730 [Gracilibacillus salitolerans]|uniref:Lipid-A-disaccharide synthase n=1 Tax=Gracilibacillus salitolerans TaxID=2663022 RepID=A0A5Q2TKF0_9BACI|nr:hypothetical protein [Gracilibacillus salitolerans]QGH35226.1 hypothetical protein GI584_14730 [Gracilibacillus salitolerans]